MLDGLARMAGRVKAGALEHLRHLVADIGDLPRRTGIGARGEQADEAQFALKPAVGRIELDADIIHADAAMNTAVHIGLGDDEDGRLAHEFADFRRHHHHFGAAAQDLHIGIAQDAEALARADFVRPIGVGREAIFAQAQEGEIVGAQPLQELVGFGDLVDRQRRRIGVEGLDRLLDTGAHGPPVGNAGAHVVERLGKAVDQLLAVGIGVETGDVEMDQAFALAFCPLWQRFAVETQELALLVALHGDDRVGDQRDFDALLGELRHGRIEQEGHVVVENFEHGNLAPVRHHRIDHADIGTARRALLHMFPGLFCQEGQGQRHRSWRDPRCWYGRTEARQRSGESCPAARFPLPRGSGLPAPCRHARRHNVLHFSRRPTAVAIVCLILECISSSSIVLTAIDRVSESSVSELQ